MLLLALLLSQEWPQWRGEKRDGVWRETGELAEFKDGRVPRVWSLPIGAGYAGPVVAGGRVYVTDRLKEPEAVERVLCVDAKTGKRLWLKSYPCVYEGFTYTAGPRASVTVADGVAYALGAAGHLHALDAVDGRPLWARDLRKDHRIRMPDWGISASPLVEGELLITQISGEGEACVIALDRRSGETRWTSLPDKAAYAAPMAVDQGGRRVVIVPLADRVVGLDAPTGALVWSYAMPGSRWPITISTPVLEGDLLFVTTAHVGAALLRLKPGAVEEVWRRDGRNPRSADTLHSVMTTPLILEGRIVGAHTKGEMRCLELMTGKRLWEDTRANPPDTHASFHLGRWGETGDTAWIFNEKGELIFARLTATGFEERTRGQLIEPTKEQLKRGVTWSHPAFAGGRVFIRNDQELVCAQVLR